MTKILCKYLDCLFLDDRHCSAAAIEITQEDGCLTYRPSEDDVSISDWDDDLEWDEDDDTVGLWEVEEEEDQEDDEDEA